MLVSHSESRSGSGGRTGMSLIRRLLPAARGNLLRSHPSSGLARDAAVTSPYQGLYRALLLSLPLNNSENVAGKSPVDLPHSAAVRLSTESAPRAAARLTLRYLPHHAGPARRVLISARLQSSVQAIYAGCVPDS